MFPLSTTMPRCAAVSGPHRATTVHTGVQVKQYKQYSSRRTRFTTHATTRGRSATTNNEAQTSAVEPLPMAAPAQPEADKTANRRSSSSTSSSQHSQVSPLYRPFLAEWDKGFLNNHEEQPEGYWMELIEGAVPKALEGTLYRYRGWLSHPLSVIVGY